MRRVMTIAAVTCLSITASCGSDGPAAADADVSGRWALTLATAVPTTAGYGCTARADVDLQRSGARVEGSYAYDGTCTTPHEVRADAHAGAVENGTVDGTALRFELGICRFEGRVAAGDRLSGTVVCPRPAGIDLSFSGSWEAVREGD